MNYNIIDIIREDITNENLKDIINKKIYKILLFLEMSSLNEG